MLNRDVIVHRGGGLESGWDRNFERRGELGTYRLCTI